MVLISVIIPVFKVEKYLEKCIKSIVNQTIENLEIILVDDGSPDQCPKICDYWASKDSRIKVVHKKNGGLSDARNAGLDIAKGEYISFIDSDDWVALDMYEIMLKAMKEENADICACGIMGCYQNKNVPMPIRPIVGDSKSIFSMLYSDALYPVATWNKLYKRKCWLDLRFPEGKICEDAFTTYKLIAHANCIVQIEDILYFYRIRSNSIMTSKFNVHKMDEEEAWRENYIFIEQNYPELKKMAYDFYLQRVNKLIHSMDVLERIEFKKEYEYLHQILKENLFYILIRSQMKMKCRIRLFLDYYSL